MSKISKAFEPIKTTCQSMIFGLSSKISKFSRSFPDTGVSTAVFSFFHRLRSQKSTPVLQESTPASQEKIEKETAKESIEKIEEPIEEITQKVNELTIAEPKKEEPKPLTRWEKLSLKATEAKNFIRNYIQENPRTVKVALTTAVVAIGAGIILRNRNNAIHPNNAIQSRFDFNAMIAGGKIANGSVPFDAKDAAFTQFHETSQPISFIETSEEKSYINNMLANYPGSSLQAPVLPKEEVPPLFPIGQAAKLEVPPLYPNSNLLVLRDQMLSVSQEVVQNLRPASFPYIPSFFESDVDFTSSDLKEDSQWRRTKKIMDSAGTPLKKASSSLIQTVSESTAAAEARNIFSTLNPLRLGLQLDTRKGIAQTALEKVKNMSNSFLTLLAETTTTAEERATVRAATEDLQSSTDDATLLYAKYAREVAPSTTRSLIPTVSESKIAEKAKHILNKLPAAPPAKQGNIYARNLSSTDNFS